VIIEQHYGRPMDIEWGKDGADGKLYILQARPETVKSQAAKARSSTATSSRAPAPCWPKAAPSARRSAPARCAWCTHRRDGPVQPGDVLVTDMTDPNWEPVMKRASAIVTNRGGRTCHAAIIARELGIPAVVGCGDATER
jgi:pyruvate,water dikinase